MAKDLKILVVDDTVTYRKIMRDVVDGLDNTELIGSAPNGRIALKKIASKKPDLVLLDVEMPGMDGLETLREIRKLYPLTGVVMVSGASAKSANITIESLEAGAIDFVEKPAGLGMEKSLSELRNKLRPLIKLFKTKHQIARYRQDRKTRQQKKQISKKPKKPTRKVVKTPGAFDILAIGVSTGGPEALVKLIPKLPPNFPIPVVVVQHMPEIFTRSLAMNLDNKSSNTVKEAEDGELLAAGNIYIAKGGKHMILRKAEDDGKSIGIIDTPPVKSCKPSVDVLFRSVASLYSGKIICSILTGMGNDGLDGVAAMKRRGCYCITQSKASCVVYGMPRAVVEAGYSDLSADIEDIAGIISDKIKNQRKVA